VSRNSGSLGIGAFRDTGEISVARLEFGSLGEGNKTVWVVKPMTFMNRSGEPLRNFCRQKGFSIEDVLVVHDELDVDPFVIRLKFGGGEGGHNGLRSISSSFGTKEYARLRFGIGKPLEGREEILSWVLGKFPKQDEGILEAAADRGAEIIEEILKNGFKQTQNFVNQGITKT